MYNSLGFPDVSDLVFITFISPDLTIIQIDYTEKLLLDYRNIDAKGTTPRFEFGFGLSYTTFAYSALSISSSGDTYTLTFTIQNSGSLSGTEKPQVYVGYPSVAGEPKKVLRGFEEVSLDVGASKPVTIALDRRSMRYSFFDSVYIAMVYRSFQCVGLA